MGELLDDHIRPGGRDRMVDAMLGGDVPDVGPVGNDGFRELHRSFEVLVLQHAYPVGRQHVLAIPKSTCYDLRQLRRKHLPLLRELRARGIDCLRRELGLPERAPEPAVLCGFSYPADYNQLHLHLVVPPFRSMALFDRRVFYLFEEVEGDIERRGAVKPHPIPDPDSEDAYLAKLAKIDQVGRDLEAA